MVEGRIVTGHAGISDAVSVPRGREDDPCAVCNGVIIAAHAADNTHPLTPRHTYLA